MANKRAGADVVFELGKRVDKKLGTEYFRAKDGGWVKDDKDAFLKPIGITFADLKKIPDGVWKKETPYKSKTEYKTPSKKDRDLREHSSSKTVTTRCRAGWKRPRSPVNNTPTTCWSGGCPG
ncbi:MAG: hypothetical protein MZV70_74650 [Desulfobacterales bacterium]|nr:hypothetical protein [Desulfobacterales bacterium]